MAYLSRSSLYNGMPPPVPSLTPSYNPPTEPLPHRQRAGPTLLTTGCQCATNYGAQIEWGHSGMGSLAKQTCRAWGARRGWGREGGKGEETGDGGGAMSHFSNRLDTLRPLAHPTSVIGETPNPRTRTTSHLVFSFLKLIEKKNVLASFCITLTSSLWFQYSTKPVLKLSLNDPAALELHHLAQKAKCHTDDSEIPLQEADGFTLTRPSDFLVLFHI